MAERPHVHEVQQVALVLRDLQRAMEEYVTRLGPRSTREVQPSSAPRSSRSARSSERWQRDSSSQ